MANSHGADKPSTRYEVTEYNRSERLLSRLRDIYGQARSFHWAHAQILETLKRDIYDTRDFKKLTPYYRGVYDGTLRTLARGLYDHLEWRVYWRGKLVPSKEVQAGTWNEVESDKGAHVWRDAPERIF